MPSCQRCKQTTNGPQAFLLTCRGCSKTWHHRCHMPPVEDDELMRRIRAMNTGDVINGLGTWTCRRCKKTASMSSREPTVSSESCDHRRSLTTSYSPSATSTTGHVASISEIPIKQGLSALVDVRPLDREQSDRQELTEATPVNHSFAAKRAKPSARKLPHEVQRDATPLRDPDVQMTDIDPATQEQTGKHTTFFQVPQDTGAQMSVDIVSAMSAEDDVEMRIDDFLITSSDTIPTTTQAHNQATRTSSIVPVSAHVRAASLTNERERETRPADGAAVQPQVNEDAEDDDDLYGPPVERRIIRILPSLAEELREQQRRAVADKEKLKRAPLAPDWILARHMHDPLWKEVRTMAGDRGRQKPIARKLGENGLNVDELLGFLSFRNSEDLSRL